MQSVSIIRNRGQLTIPDTIRKTVRWVEPMSAVSISVIRPDEIVIRPHQRSVDWNKIWEGIRKARTTHGKGKISAFEFIQRDRLSH